MGVVLDFVLACWAVLGAMGPYLLLGFLVAGLLSVAFSPQWVERHLGRESFGSVVKAALMGVPLPLCSCGVLPVSASMRRHGAGKAAATSFLISTPQTGIDSIAATYAVLGPLIAVYRPIVALLSGVIGGFLVYRLVGIDGAAEPTQSGGQSIAAGCAAAGDSDAAKSDAPAADAALPVCAAAGAESHSRTVAGVSDCCGGAEGDSPSSQPRWMRALSYGLLELPRDIGAALLFGVLIAGAVSAFVPPSALAAVLGGGPIAMLLIVLAAVPFYVCATGSVPIAAGLIHLGASPGVAFAFLVAGPASNAASLTVLGSLLGRRVMLIYLATVVASAVGGGLLLDQLLRIGPARWSDAAVACAQHAEGVSTATHLWALTLLGVIALAYLLPRLRTAGAAQTVASLWQWRVGGMHCSHCAASIERCVGELPGVESVDVCWERQTLSVRGRGVAADSVEAAVRQLGYSAERLPTDRSTVSSESGGG